MQLVSDVILCLVGRKSVSRSLTVSHSLFPLITDDVFLPKDLDPTEMDEIDREVEYFKR